MLLARVVLQVGLLLERNGLHMAVPAPPITRGLLTLPSDSVRCDETIAEACERILSDHGVVALQLRPEGFHVDELDDGRSLVTIAFRPKVWVAQKPLTSYFWAAVDEEGDRMETDSA